MLLYYFVSRKACGSRALELSSLGATPALGILSLVLEPAPAAEDILFFFFYSTVMEMIEITFKHVYMFT